MNGFYNGYGYEKLDKFNNHWIKYLCLNLCIYYILYSTQLNSTKLLFQKFGVGYIDSLSPL